MKETEEEVEGGFWVAGPEAATATATATGKVGLILGIGSDMSWRNRGVEKKDFVNLMF